jgi:hypothetical protein
MKSTDGVLGFLFGTRPGSIFIPQLVHGEVVYFLLSTFFAGSIHPTAGTMGRFWNAGWGAITKSGNP